MIKIETRRGFLIKTGGFSLLEIAICVLMIGISLVTAISLYNVARSEKRYALTQDRLEQIRDALSMYAETAGRIPCPANPAETDDRLFGWEIGVGTGDIQVNANRFPVGRCAVATEQDGIVPFLTLGIPSETAIDGWGNYFTYAVSPVFTQANDNSYGPADQAIEEPRSDQGTVHGRCRTPGWVVNRNLNINPIKARFCCANRDAATPFNPATDLRINYTDGTQISPVRSNFNALDPISTVPTTPSVYAPLGQITYDSATDTDYLITKTPLAGTRTTIETPAVVIVSHGPDGRGAYLVNGTNGRTVGATGNDAENANSDRTFVDGPASLGNNINHFDDIVRWMTQDGIMAAHGALSCSYP